MRGVCECYHADYEHECDENPECPVLYHCFECGCYKFRLIGYVWTALNYREIEVMNGG